MAEFDWQQFGRTATKTRTDIGIAPIVGALGLGLKKLALDRDPEPRPNEPKPASKKLPK